MSTATVTRRLGIVAGVLATVVIGPSGAVADALAEANSAPLRTPGTADRNATTAAVPLVRVRRLLPA